MGLVPKSHSSCSLLSMSKTLAWEGVLKVVVVGVGGSSDCCSSLGLPESVVLAFLSVVTSHLLVSIELP